MCLYRCSRNQITEMEHWTQTNIYQPPYSSIGMWTQAGISAAPTTTHLFLPHVLSSVLSYKALGAVFYLAQEVSNTRTKQHLCISFLWCNCSPGQQEKGKWAFPSALLSRDKPLKHSVLPNICSTQSTCCEHVCLLWGGRVRIRTPSCSAEEVLALLTVKEYLMYNEEHLNMPF